jgi:hypothetical protein
MLTMLFLCHFLSVFRYKNKKQPNKFQNQHKPEQMFQKSLVRFRTAFGSSCRCRVSENNKNENILFLQCYFLSFYLTLSLCLCSYDARFVILSYFHLFLLDVGSGRRSRVNNEEPKPSGKPTSAANSGHGKVKSAEKNN